MCTRSCCIVIVAAVLVTLFTASCGWCGTVFNDGFASNSIGSAWSVVDDPSPSCKSAWKMGGGVLTENSNIYRTSSEYSFWQGSHIVAGNSSWKNYEFSATCSSSDDDGWGMIVRYKDPNNYYRFITVADSGNKGPFRRLEKFVNGTRTVLAEDKSAFQTGKAYNVKISAIRSKLTLTIDGKTVLTATDNTFSSGKVGFLTYANSGFTAKSVLVTSSDSTGSPTPATPKPVPVKNPAPASATTTNWSDALTKSTIGSAWSVVDDPSPSCKSAWKMGGGVLTENSNIYRTEREYDFWQGSHIVAGNSSWKNYEFSATCTSSDDDGWGMIVRYKDPNNYYRFITVADSGNKGPFRRLEKFVNGTRTVLAEDKSAFQTGKAYNVKLSAVGSKLTLLIDGKAVLSATDSTFTSGKVGFLTYANSGFTAKNVQVKTLK